MERIYDDAKDKNVAAVIVYTKSVSSSLYAYKDAAKTEAFTSSELKDAFIKGCVVRVEDDGDYLGLASPTSYAEGGTSEPSAISILFAGNSIFVIATDPEIA